MLKSLHGRLFVALLMMLGTIWVAVLTQARHEAARSAADEVDERLESSFARLLQVVVVADPAAHASGGDPDGRILPVPPEPSGGSRDGSSRLPSFEIVWNDGRTPLRSADFPRAVGATPSGFEERRVGKRTWRVLTVVDRRRGVTGRVALDDLARRVVATKRDREAVRPLLWILPFLAIAALASVWYGLAPLRKLERSVAGQEPLDLRRLELDPRRMPSELGRLVTVIERLLVRLRDVQSGQRAFTAAAGHELRTPLAGCSVQLQVARRSRDAVSRNRALEQAGRAIDAMDRLVGQLLILARADSRVTEVPKRRLDLVALLADAIERHAGDEVDVTLRMRSEMPELFVLGNITLLDCAVSNLIANAIKFSPPRAVVDVTIDRRSDRVVVRVSDRGPGIPENERERVFDPFYRAGGTSGPGSGLGLATVRSIVSDHGGEVHLEASPGGGTDAVVTLPIA